MKRTHAIVGVLALFAAGVFVASSLAWGSHPEAAATTATTTSGKATICHRTGSKTNPFVTITVGQSAVAAHMRHGDKPGSCPAKAAAAATTQQQTTQPPQQEPQQQTTTTAPPPATAPEPVAPAPAQTHPEHAVKSGHCNHTHARSDEHARSEQSDEQQQQQSSESDDASNGDAGSGGSD